jgi:hypothetical protein
MHEQAVYKYELKWSADPQEVTMPLTTRVVHFDAQHGQPTIWVLTEPDDTLVTETFVIRATGEIVGDPRVWMYVGTVLEGPYVWHLFQKNKLFVEHPA